jgi:hypothetical protein
MKKAYAAPEARAVTLRTEGMMAGSLTIKVDGSDTGSIDFSNESGGWDSGNWSGAAEED